ncbi:MAG: hypothetical protein Q8Q14_05245 [Gemmatimonadales bacterium]|nr:hypothetical protein [Gemmatimonadales bacterium]
MRGRLGRRERRGGIEGRRGGRRLCAVRGHTGGLGTPRAPPGGRGRAIAAVVVEAHHAGGELAAGRGEGVGPAAVAVPILGAVAARDAEGLQSGEGVLHLPLG